MGVDNTTILPANSTIGRNTIEINSTTFFNGGLWILSLDNVPVGPGVWPAFWSTAGGGGPPSAGSGGRWPNDGEIDILEAIDVNTTFFDHNQISLHSGTSSYW